MSAHPAAVPASQRTSTQTPVSQNARQALSRRGSASAAAADMSHAYRALEPGSAAVLVMDYP